ncbi:MAG: cation transporter [Schwartzia sp.]|nr:cation transporter [Schwartzia sp. (in: firmicutes)]MBR5163038.1 cation transporter [Schwartzia sp. (in: firmicutes)]
MVLDRLLLLPNEGDGYAARQKCGERAGAIGIGVNLVLFAVKLAVGVACGAVAVVADALNNLSDAGTSLAMIFGFRIAGRPADAEHPFGHGRAEYLAGLFVAAVILLVGVELFRTSIEKIFAPEPLTIDRIGVTFLALSLLLKVGLASMYFKVGKRIQSAALEAAGTDSLTDCIATSGVLVSLGAYAMAGINIDGWAGVFVSGFILYSGWEALRAAADPLLGTANDSALAADIRRIVMEEKGVLGVHDLVLHGYGAGRTFATLDIELPAEMPLIEAHNIADRVERRIQGALSISVTVHIDPVATDDPEADRLFVLASRLLTSIDTRLSMHDFHIVPYRDGRKISFEVSCPEDFDMSDRELRRAFLRRFLAKRPRDRAIMHVDHHFC